MDLFTAKQLCKELMAQHGLTDWGFEFSNAKLQCGTCWYKQKLIKLSKHYVSLNSIELVRNTILHEIAHALTPGQKHNHVWKAKCVEIGCLPNRLNESATMPKGRYAAKCGHCKSEFFTHRKTKRKYHCVKCGPILGSLSWRTTQTVNC